MSRQISRAAPVRRVHLSAAVCAAGLVLVAWLSQHILVATTTGHAWEDALTSSVMPFADGVWRLLRGGLAYLAAPALVLVAVAAIVTALRTRGRRTGLGQLVLLIGANATVQAIKYSVLPFGFVSPEQLDLSGHAGLTASTILAVLLAVPTGSRRFSIWCAWLSLSAVVIAILLSRWHSLTEVLVPMFICGAWAAAVYAALSAPRTAPASARRTWSPAYGAFLAASGFLVVVLIGCAAWLGAWDWPAGGGVAGVLGASFAVAAGAAAMTVGVASAFLPADPVPNGGQARRFERARA